MKIQKFLLVCILITTFGCSKEEATPPTPTKYNVSISLNPNEGGTVSPNGGQFNEGQTVSFNATASENYIFTNWSGSDTSSNNPLSLTINSNKTLTANFEKKDTDGDGVTDDIDQCPNTTSGEEVNETGCSSSQIDTDGDGVMDDMDTCPDTPEDETSDSNGCSVSQKEFELIIATEGEGTVTEELIVSTTIYQGTSQVKLTAVPNEGWELSEWTGDVTGNENPVIIEMDGAKSVTVVFTKKDTDGDGVPDLEDNCVDTPQGDRVDENGCTITPVYLDENGVTLKVRDWVEVGQTVEYEGEEYVVVDNISLREIIENEGDYSKVITTYVTDMSYLFSERSPQYSVIFWDTENVSNMTGMFEYTVFDQDISSWNVSNVNSTSVMFRKSTFNQDISNWDTGSLTDISSMFFGNEKFNQPIGSWDVSNVTNMYAVFYESNFNQDISEWDVGKVTNMGFMFHGTQFNQNISTWNVSNVTNMERMFDYNSSFNQDISEWDVGKVTKMWAMFFKCESFNQDLSNWNVSNVVDCDIFSRDATNWILPRPNFTNCDPGYRDTDNDGVFDYVDECPDTPEGNKVDENGCDLPPIRLHSNGVTIIAEEWTEVGDIGYIDGVEYTIVDNDLLNLKRNENADMTKLVTTKVTSMNRLFNNVYEFNQDLGSWDTSNVVDMSYLFAFSSFDYDISMWNTSNVTNMSYMFRGTPFNHPVGNWDVSSVVTMDWMFSEAENFNQPVGEWDVSKVVNMYRLFYGTPFNQSIENWNVSNVENMASMFDGAAFNQPIGIWDVSSVKHIYYMFRNAKEFNHDISEWNITNVTLANEMFKGAESFNQDLSDLTFTNAEECWGFSTGATSWTLPKPNFPKCNPN